MLISSELREIADFVDANTKLFDLMVSFKDLNITFNEKVSGGFIVSRNDGTPLGRIEITDAGVYEFVPETV